MISLVSNITWADNTTNHSCYIICGDFLSVCESKTSLSFVASTTWVMGYISAKTYRENL
jgi:hypothetical protein